MATRWMVFGVLLLAAMTTQAADERQVVPQSPSRLHVGR